MEETDPRKVLHFAVRAIKYRGKVGPEGWNSDLFITVGEERFPFEGFEKEGFFEPEVCEQIMAHPSNEICCLCSPEYDVIYVLKDQMKATCGAVALARNHNALAIFNRRGTLISNHRFQNLKRNPEKPLFPTITDSLDLFAMSEGMIK